VSRSGEIKLEHGVIGNARVLATGLFYWPQSHTNGIGLFSEDIGPRPGRLVGNLPQTCTHIAPINTAMTISELIELRDARFRAWS
jgi:GH15 family glucan-1,4-alpha-glucosidase